MNITKITAAAATAAALGLLATPLASADTTGVSGPAVVAFDHDGKIVGPNFVQEWTVSGLKPSTDVVQLHVNGTLWEATAEFEAEQGSSQPFVPNLNARAASGETYPVLWGAATPQGINPSGLDQGQESKGKIYFDVTGPVPTSVVYTDNGRDVLIWQGSAPSTPATAPSTGGTHSATPAGTPAAAATPAPAAIAAPAANTVPTTGGLGSAASTPATAVATGTPATGSPSTTEGSQPVASTQNPANVPVDTAPQAGTPAAANPAATPAPTGTPAAAGTPAANGQVPAATNGETPADASPGAAAAVSGPTLQAPTAPAVPAAQAPAASAAQPAAAGNTAPVQGTTAPAAGAPVIPAPAS